MITIKSAVELVYMRAAGEIVANTLRLMQDNAKEGISTKELDKIAYNYIKSQKAIPSFLNYAGFPASICTSLNKEVVHGIPNKKTVLKNGDIISVDVGACFKGYHSDAARTFAVGTISDEAKRLIRVTEQSFFEGIKYAKDGNHLYDISAAIQAYVEKNGYSVVRDLVGHGIGAKLHEEPNVPNFGKAGKGTILQANMTLAIEPMVNQGAFKVAVLDNEWTVVTCDGKLSAHYENTVIITKTGECEILTLY